MEVYLIITIIILVTGFSVTIYLATRKKPQKDEQSLLMLQNQLKEIRETMDNKLGESHKSIQQQFGQSAKIIKDVTEQLTKLDDTNKQVVGFAQQLQSLENVLKNPKQRGVLGEVLLQTVLENVMAPNQFQMQYKFNNGDIVDAIVKTKEGIIPIDSKFSLENYNKIIEEKDPAKHVQFEKQFKQDLKYRIDETSKYIRPREKTTEFAFMFIPSEAIYYDLLVNKVGAIQLDTGGLIDYAFKNKKVIIVSPTTFLAYLQTVLQGLRALKIEESAKGIRNEVEKLGRHLFSYDSFMNKLGTSLGTTVSHFNNASKEFKKIDKDVLKIADVGGKTEVMELEKPNTEE
jgi:DNA recombination protein RmuC